MVSRSIQIADKSQGARILRVGDHVDVGLHADLDRAVVLEAKNARQLLGVEVDGMAAGSRVRSGRELKAWLPRAARDRLPHATAAERRHPTRW